MRRWWKELDLKFCLVWECLFVCFFFFFFLVWEYIYSNIKRKWVKFRISWSVLNFFYQTKNNKVRFTDPILWNLDIPKIERKITYAKKRKKMEWWIKLKELFTSIDEYNKFILDSAHLMCLFMPYRPMDHHSPLPICNKKTVLWK